MLVTDECFLAIHGTLRPHAWITLKTLKVDAYGLFHTYSEALGWIRQPTDPAFDSALWNLHEAGGDWSTPPSPAIRNIFWAQVGLTAASKSRNLPVNALLICAEKSMSRIGAITVTGVQMLIPIRDGVTINPKSLSNLFFASPPETCPLVIEIDGGENGDIEAIVSAALGQMNLWFRRDDIEFHAAGTLHDSDRIVKEPDEMERDIWIGRSEKQFLFTVEFPEFSLEVAGSIAEHFARALQIAGFEGAAFITIARSSTDS